MLKSGLSLRCKVWLVRDGERVFGNGLARLCEAIRERRSLKDAAQACGVSYRHAWNLIRSAERRFGKRLTVSKAGGAEGGGSRLSAEGARLLQLYRAAADKVRSHTATVFRRLVTRGKGSSR